MQIAITSKNASVRAVETSSPTHGVPKSEAQLCDNLIKVYGFRRKLLFAREREELVGKLFATPDRLSGIAQQLQQGVFIDPALDHLEIAEDCREQIVEGRARHRP